MWTDIAATAARSSATGNVDREVIAAMALRVALQTDPARVQVGRASSPAIRDSSEMGISACELAPPAGVAPWAVDSRILTAGSRTTSAAMRPASAAPTTVQTVFAARQARPILKGPARRPAAQPAHGAMETRSRCAEATVHWKPHAARAMETVACRCQETAVRLPVEVQSGAISRVARTRIAFQVRNVREGSVREGGGHLAALPPMIAQPVSGACLTRIRTVRS